MSTAHGAPVLHIYCMYDVYMLLCGPHVWCMVDGAGDMDHTRVTGSVACLLHVVHVCCM